MQRNAEVTSERPNPLLVFDQRNRLLIAERRNEAYEVEES